MDFSTIGVYELWNMAGKPDVYMIDLRDRKDYRRNHIDGAHNLPYDEIGKWQNTLPKGKRIVLYCEHGSVSMLAAKRLAAKGYHIYTLVGGISALNGRI